MKPILLIAVLILSAVTVFGQARTANKLMDQPFSSLETGNPEPGQVRYCINCKRQNGPCVAAGVGETPIGADALKTPNGWMCASRAAGSGSGTVTTFTAGNAVPLFTTSVASGTTSPALTFNLIAQTAKMFFAGPSSGVAAAPSFRAVAPSDFITGVVGLSKCIGTDGSGNIVTKAADCGAGGGGGGDALTSLPLSQFAGTSSFQFFTVLTNKTGTGLSVFGTSPTITSPIGIVKGDVGLGNVDNTSDSTKNAATATLINKTINGSGNTLFNLPAAGILGVIPIANLATGTPNGTKFIRDDGTLQPIPGGGDALTTSPLSQFASTTSTQLATVLSDEVGNSGGFVRANNAAFTGTFGIPSPFTLGATSVTVTGTEINRLAGVTSSIQSQLDNRPYNAGAAPDDSIAIWALSGLAILGTNIKITNLTGGLNDIEIPGLIEMQEITAPANPAANKLRLYVKDAAGITKLYYRDSAGTETLLGSGGGSGTVTVNGGGNLINTAMVTGAGTQLVQTPCATCTLSAGGDFSTPGVINVGVGGSAAGFFGLTQGTAQSVVTSTVGLTAPTSVTGYNIVFPSAAWSGLLQFTNVSNIVTATNAIATDLSAPVTCSDAGSTDTYACSLAPAPAAYATGSHYRFKANTINTGAATINLNSLGAKTIKKVAGGITTDLDNNDIRAGQWVDLVYDGTNMQMQSLLGNAATGTVTPSSTDTFTNKTEDTEATGNVFTSVFKTWFAGAGCANTTASSFWDLPTATPAVAACVTGTNTQKGVLQFADTSGGFSAQTGMLLPADFSGAVDARIIWRTSATSGNAKFSLSTICTDVAATATDDPAFNTASTVTTAAPGTANRLQTSSISSVTITGCSAGNLLHLKLFRDGNDGSDTLSASLDVIGVEITTRRAQ